MPVRCRGSTSRPDPRVPACPAGSADPGGSADPADPADPADLGPLGPCRDGLQRPRFIRSQRPGGAPNAIVHGTRARRPRHRLRRRHRVRARGDGRPRADGL
ncbi:MAG: hypothetical protein C0498_00535 [Anaerolinea sp.]|nr:hypothetical protein [Anaerolinea sp.]